MNDERDDMRLAARPSPAVEPLLSEDALKALLVVAALLAAFLLWRFLRRVRNQDGTPVAAEEPFAEWGYEK